MIGLVDPELVLARFVFQSLFLRINLLACLGSRLECWCFDYLDNLCLLESGWTFVQRGSLNLDSMVAGAQMHAEMIGSWTS